MPAAQDSLVVWDVIDEHLDEAEFALGRWRASLHSPDFTLSDVASGPEDRLLSNLEGLALGGPDVAEHKLLPILESEGADMAFDEAALRTVATWALLVAGKALAPIHGALRALDPAEHDGIPAAFALWESPRRVAQIAYGLSQAPVGTRHLWLRAMADARGEPEHDALVVALAQGADTNERVAALAAMRCADRRRYRAAAEHFLEHDDGAVRSAALRTALLWRSPDAWRFATQRACSPEDPEATEAVAIFGSPARRRALAEWSAEASSAENAIWAAGLTGHADAAEALMAALEDGEPRRRRLAYEAIRTITGLTVEHAPCDEAPPEEPDDVDALPLPNPDAAQRWWADHRDRFDARTRYLFGQPYSSEWVCDVLVRGPMRQRQALAREVALRTQGALDIPTGALSWVQRDAVAKLRTHPVDFQTPLSPA